jgi:hypothetical protein
MAISFFANQGCLAGDFGACHKMFPHGRVHFVDRRKQRGSLYDVLFEHVFAIQRAVDSGSLKRIRAAAKTSHTALAEKYPTVTSILQALRSSFDGKTNKSAKQLEAIAEPAIARKVMAWIAAHEKRVTTEHGAVYKEAVAAMRRVAAPGSTPRDAECWLECHFSAIDTAVLEVTALEMDVYAMGRLLRTFKDGTTIARCIVYAGDGHIRNYERLLHALGWRNFGRVEYLSTRCVKVIGATSFMGGNIIKKT